VSSLKLKTLVDAIIRSADKAKGLGDDLATLQHGTHGERRSVTAGLGSERKPEGELQLSL